MMNIAELPKYDVYKDSGNEWLGVIPKDWAFKKFKYLARVKKGKIPKRIVSVDSFNLPPYLSMDYLRGTDAKQFVDDRNAVLVEDGAILLLWDGSNAGEFVLGKWGVVSSTLANVDFFSVNKKFAWYACQLTEMELRSTTVGMGIPHVDGEQLKNSILAIPSPNEQVLIANFLDKKTAQIDDAITIKEQQISLLKERKQIIIQQAVTCGLDPNVPMKDSGVDWIGKIPEHWEVFKLSHIAKIDAGSTPDRSNSKYWNGYIPWIKTGEVKYSKIYETEEYITSTGLKNSSLRLAPVNTLVMAMYGQGVTRGRVAILGVPATYNQACCGMTFKELVSVEYAQYFFMAAYPHIRDDGNESSQMNLSAGYISSLKMCTTSFDEQLVIVKYLDEKIAKIEEAILLQFAQIEKLKEYKTTLINNAVTGKIKISPEMVEQ